MLRREGWAVNAKRIYRLYTADGLAVRTKVRKKIARRASFEAAPHLNEQVQTLDGVAQTIYSLPLKSIPEVGFNAEVPQALNRVIIGPSQGQAALKGELIRMLTEMAVPNPTDKIFVSDISLRDLP
jgi:hypothetical protein